MAVHVEDAHVKIDFDGNDTDQCFIAVGNPEPAPDGWQPAFKSYRRNGARVLQVPLRRFDERFHGQTVVVWRRINGYVERVSVARL